MIRTRPWTGRAEPRGESGEINMLLLTQPRHRDLLVSAPCIRVIRLWCRCSKWYSGADSGGTLLPWRCRWASITLSGLLGNCFSAPRLFAFCNWLVRLKVSEVSASELIVSVRQWILCSDPPAPPPDSFITSHFPSTVPFPQSVYFFLLTLFVLPVCPNGIFQMIYLSPVPPSAWLLIGFWKKMKTLQCFICVTLSWTFSDES